jgi:uncharacterized protein
MMDDEEFEWDQRKAEQNFQKHGIRFEAATLIFRDPFALDFVDHTTDEGEERFAIIGWSNGLLLTAIYTERNERTRIISVRKATRNEAKLYYRGQTRT